MFAGLTGMRYVKKEVRLPRKDATHEFDKRDGQTNGVSRLRKEVPAQVALRITGHADRQVTYELPPGIVDVLLSHDLLRP